MPHSVKESILFAFCDPGTVDGKFMNGVLNTIFWAKENKINIVGKIRATGNQIGRQRQGVFDAWADQQKSDWLLWIDSDIVLTPKAFKLVWDAADKDIRPVVSGLYFVSKENEKTLMQPMPALFKEGKDKYELEIINQIPHNQVIKIDCAGFGFLLMHKSIIPKMRKISPEYSLFAEEEGLGNKYISEDIVFFRKLKAAGVDLYAHTGATVEHMKRFSFDANYYNVYWNALEKELFTKE
jgi:GT2 family glycosyltransferase